MSGNGQRPTEINLEKAVKKTLEEIVERGWIENQEEQILISTAALIGEFLHARSDQDNRKVKAQIEERRKEVGFFFPPITEAFLSWREEGREDIPEKIKRLSELGEI